MVFVQTKMASSSAIVNLVSRVLVSRLLVKRDADSGNKIAAILGYARAYLILRPAFALDVGSSLTRALVFASHV